MSEELAVRSEEEQALIAAQDTELEGVSFQVPILKIGQPLTREVGNGDAEVGEFINTLTAEGLGEQVDFIVAYYNQGRFASDKDSGRAYTAFDTVIPASWADLVGEEFVGTPFVEYQDAEERFKERVNSKEIEWGKGPLVSTTHNYTGLVVVPQEEGDDGELEYSPVRLSLQRTNMPAVRKFTQVQRAMLRNKPFYDIVFALSTYSKSFAKGTAYLLNPKPGRKTTAEERADALQLGLAVRAGRVAANDEATADATAPTEAPAKGGGLGI
jgi:hypothetical protein